MAVKVATTRDRGNSRRVLVKQDKPGERWSAWRLRRLQSSRERIFKIIVAKRQGSTKQWYGAMVKGMLADADDVLRDWVHVEVLLPAELSREVRHMEAWARARAKTKMGTDLTK